MDQLFRLIDPRAAAGWATALDDQIGNLAAVLVASEERLDRALCDPRAISLVMAVRSALELATAVMIEDRPVIGSLVAVHDYLRLRLAGRATESARVLYLDARSHLIRDEQVSEGTADHTPIAIPLVARRALELGATAIILVHNHPSGNATPSSNDIRLTHQLISALKPLGIIVHDHLVVAATSIASLRGEGHM